MMMMMNDEKGGDDELDDGSGGGTRTVIIIIVDGICVNNHDFKSFTVLMNHGDSQHTVVMRW